MTILSKFNVYKNLLNEETHPLKFYKNVGDEI